ncbi:MAG: hypothetical protein V7L23_03085 [Nostoc sp.]|uniref:hypothetical protein n=1 Tax=Nostoc sp. TaxID=1180 RepID=UPI002FF1B82D
MPISHADKTINPTELLEARKKFVIDHFNKAGLTEGAQSLIDIYAAIEVEDNQQHYRRSYLEFLLKVMG